MTGQAVTIVLVKGYPRLSETFVAQEVRSLERAGFRLRIVSMRRPTDTALHPVHREIEAPVTYLPEYLHESPGRVARALLAAIGLPGFRRALSEFIRDLAKDFSRGRLRRFGQAAVMAAETSEDDALIYAHFIHTPASVARYASLLSGLPWACSAHAKDIWTTPEAELAVKLRHAAFTVTCTKAGQERLGALAPVEKPVALVHHGIDIGRFKPLFAPSIARNGGDAAMPVRFLTVARAVEKKGLDTLIDALGLLPPDVHWNWTHIGGGSLTQVLEAQAARLGIAGHCRFLGAKPQSDVLAAYAAADVFVLPCRIAADGDRDGLPNVLMEAGAHGLALLSTPLAGVSELVIEGETGLIVQPDDPVLLSDALRRLAGDPLLRAKLGRAAARKVSSEFDHEQTIHHLLTKFPSHLRERPKQMQAVE
jgi:glycosyltransferase involved in cell wall biosynthesis